MTTTARNETLQLALAKADPNNIGDLLRIIRFDRMCAVVKIVVTSMDADASPDITAAAVLDHAVVTGLQLADGEMLPPIGDVVSLRVTASGTAASLGVYGVGDDGATAIIPPGGAGAAMGIAKLSDDGKELTFPNTVTGFTLIYRPRAAYDISTTQYVSGL